MNRANSNSCGKRSNLHVRNVRLLNLRATTLLNLHAATFLYLGRDDQDHANDEEDDDNYQHNHLALCIKCMTHFIVSVAGGMVSVAGGMVSVAGHCHVIGLRTVYFNIY